MYDVLLASRLSKENKHSIHTSSTTYNVLYRKKVCWLTVLAHSQTGVCRREMSTATIADCLSGYNNAEVSVMV